MSIEGFSMNRSASPRRDPDMLLDFSFLAKGAVRKSAPTQQSATMQAQWKKKWG